MNPIIKVENLSKCFIISHESKEKYTSLRDVIAYKAKNILKNNHRITQSKEEFWALNNISFEINKGDRIGIIGRNGAGKSTLLKILSRITAPSKGRIAIRGRVASLLEVGTGFHPELTGRENIFLNGAILGMSRNEIKRKFDEIVDFAEVEKFLDTPVKRFSSGMYVRLAFAVAAHLEPEILIIDEVLAVGDAQFQKKCLGKMEDVSRNEGRTVIFVSHNMATIKALCKSGIYLQKGQLNYFGDINDTIHCYLQNKSTIDETGLIPKGISTYNTGILRFIRLQNVKHTGEGDSIFFMAPIHLYLEIDSKKDFGEVMLDISISNSDGIIIVHASNMYDERNIGSIRQGINSLEVFIENTLQPGRYSFTIGIHEPSGTTMDYLENILDFEVLRVGEGSNPGYIFNWDIGMVRLNSKWKLNAK